MPLTSEPTDRWAWVEIDLDAVRKNTRALKGMLRRGTKLMCAVKADGYGHGAVECAKAMKSGGADQFAVATVAEGVELRKAGIEWPILMLNQAPETAIDTLVEYDIMPSVYTSEFALAYGERAAAMDKVGKYHLAIDTGMTRIGVLPDDVVEFRHAIDFHRGLQCAGTFTHFATAENIQDWDFRLQAKRFMDTVNVLRDAGCDVGMVHCDNTPGIILHPDLHNDMCRAGIGLYGLQPAETTAPEPKQEKHESSSGSSSGDGSSFTVDFGDMFGSDTVSAGEAVKESTDSSPAEAKSDAKAEEPVADEQKDASAAEPKAEEQKPEEQKPDAAASDSGASESAPAETAAAADESSRNTEGASADAGARPQPADNASDAKADETPAPAAEEKAQENAAGSASENTDAKAQEAAPAENAAAAGDAEKKDGSAQDASADAKEESKEQPNEAAAEPVKKDEAQKAEEKPADTAVQTDDWLKW